MYFRQLLSGADYGENDPVARGMKNLVYAIGDLETKDALLVDPTYDVNKLVDTLLNDGMNLVGVLATHYHGDHVGGSLMGHKVEGITTLLERHHVPIHIQKEELQWVIRGTQVSESDLTLHSSGDKVQVGSIEVELIHTPGHTPGSQCFLVNGLLIAGDTLFLEGCGRTDLPGSDPEEMYNSLFHRLNKIPDSTLLYPGHLYSQDPFDTMENNRKYNPVLAPRTPEEWLSIFS